MGGGRFRTDDIYPVYAWRIWGEAGVRSLK
jgi:hypothetical protein